MTEENQSLEQQRADVLNGISDPIEAQAVKEAIAGQEVPGPIPPAPSGQDKPSEEATGATVKPSEPTDKEVLEKACSDSFRKYMDSAGRMDSHTKGKVKRAFYVGFADGGMHQLDNVESGKLD